MPIHWLDYSIIILYFFVIVYIGWWSMQKVSSFDDYAVAGRGMPLAIFFAAIAATLCGGGATIGRVAYMHTTGVVVFAGLMGVVINQIISGLCIAGRVHSIPNVYTVGDLCGMYYGRAGRLVSSVVCFLFCLGLFGLQILPMGAILFHSWIRGFKSGEFSVRSVPIYPGLMELTRTPFFAHSIAIDFVSCITPAFDAL